MVCDNTEGVGVCQARPENRKIATEGGAKGNGSGGGCNAGLGLLALALGAAVPKRR